MFDIGSSFRVSSDEKQSCPDLRDYSYIHMLSTGILAADPSCAFSVPPTA